MKTRYVVRPMDGINLLNKSRIMTTCRADGTVLKPDRPVSTVDWCFTATGLNTGSQPCYVCKNFRKFPVANIFFVLVFFVVGFGF